MRRVRVLLLTGVCVIGVSENADAWWGWIDELSGPKGFKGMQFDVRLMCMGVPQNETYEKLVAVSEAHATQRRNTDALFTQLEQILTARLAARAAVDQQRVQQPDDVTTWLRQLDSYRQASVQADRNFGQALRKLQGQYITRAQVQELLGDSAYQRLAVNLDFINSLDLSDDLRLVYTQFRNANLALANARTAAITDPGVIIAVPFGGLRLSLCGHRDDDERKLSVGTLTRVYLTSDHSSEIASAGGPRDFEDFAGGHTMYMFTAGPTIEWRPLYFYKQRRGPNTSREVTACPQVDCQRAWGWDWIDLGGTLSYYQLGSAGFRTTLRGTTVSGYVNVRLPAHVIRQHPWARIIPLVRVAQTGFLGGFDSNAFGPKLTGPKSQAIAGPDFHKEISLFVDLGSIF